MDEVEKQRQLEPFVWAFTGFTFLFTAVNVANLLYMGKPIYKKIWEKIKGKNKTNPK